MGILRALPFPETHRQIKLRATVTGLLLRETLETRDHLVGLAGRTVVGARKKRINARIGGTGMGGPWQPIQWCVVHVVPAICRSEPGAPAGATVWSHSAAP